MTAPAHPVFFRPIIRILREHGHDVVVTARDYADTLGLLQLHGIDHVAFGRHGGARRARKLAELISRSLAMRRFGRRRGFDLVRHGSNDLALAAASLRIPALGHVRLRVRHLPAPSAAWRGGLRGARPHPARSVSAGTASV